jgi:hypothetical protein
MRKAIFLLVLFFFGGVCLADIIYLKNGNRLEGIITREDAGSLELEVFPGAKITFQKNEVNSCERAAEKENLSLRRGWEKEATAKRQAEKENMKFEAEQRSKGFVKLYDRWVKESEKEKIEEQEYLDEVLNKKEKSGELVSQERSRMAQTILTMEPWKIRQSQHFIVYYLDLNQAKLVADRAEYFFEKITYDLNFEREIFWPEKCEVFVVPDEKKWQDFLKKANINKMWVGGFVPEQKEREIFLYGRSQGHLLYTFPHELTHLVLRDFARGEKIPLWLNEGLANYESGVTGYIDEEIYNRIAKNEFIPLTELFAMNDYPQDEKNLVMFYYEAGKVVEFFISQHSRQKFSEFCRLILAKNAFRDALDKVYGEIYYSREDFVRAWLKYVLR